MFDLLDPSRMSLTIFNLLRIDDMLTKHENTWLSMQIKA